MKDLEIREDFPLWAKSTLAAYLNGYPETAQQFVDGFNELERVELRRVLAAIGRMTRKPR